MDLDSEIGSLKKRLNAFEGELHRMEKAVRTGVDPQTAKILEEIPKLIEGIGAQQEAAMAELRKSVAADLAEIRAAIAPPPAVSNTSAMPESPPEQPAAEQPKA